MKENKLGPIAFVLVAFAVFVVYNSLSALKKKNLANQNKTSQSFPNPVVPFKGSGGMPVPPESCNTPECLAQFDRAAFKAVQGKVELEEKMKRLYAECNQGRATRCTKLAFMYQENGMASQASHFFKQACLTGSGEIKACEYFGKSMSADEARHHIEKCNQNELRSCLLVAAFDSQNGKEAEMQKLMTYSCANGYWAACPELGPTLSEDDRKKAATDCIQGKNARACAMIYGSERELHNTDSAINFLKTGCGLNDSDACLELGRELITQKDQTSQNEVHNRCNTGDPNACMTKARLIMEEDPDAARTILEALCNKGVSRACYYKKDV
ncbi:hypothetical protein K2X30_07480 [bacterium]|nr:hypothetical protein [bacterium]